MLECSFSSYSNYSHMTTLAEALTLGRQLLSAGKLPKQVNCIGVLVEVPDVAEAWHWVE